MKVTNDIYKKKFGKTSKEEDTESASEKKAESDDPKLELAEAMAKKMKSKKK